MKHYTNNWEVATMSVSKRNKAYIIRPINGSYAVANICGLVGDKTAELNAHLIASAPCLLDACLASLEVLDTIPNLSPEGKHSIDLIRNAIAKAEANHGER